MCRACSVRSPWLATTTLEVWLKLVRVRGSGPRDWWFESTHLDDMASRPPGVTAVLQTARAGFDSLARYELVPLAQRQCSRPISDRRRFESFTEHAPHGVRSVAVARENVALAGSGSIPVAHPAGLVRLGRHVPRGRAALAMRLRPVRFRSSPRSGNAVTVTAARHARLVCERARFDPEWRLQAASIRCRPMAGRWPLTPEIEVRVLAPEPINRRTVVRRCCAVRRSRTFRVHRSPSG
jgi:hypothetical protein